MIKFKLQKPETYMTLLNWVGVPLIILYVISMFMYPFIQTNGDWSQVQDVWNRWQGINVGMLAFISSLVAFNISKYNSEQNRKREFIAARAFLPEAFSELTAYCRNSMDLFADAHNLRNDRDRHLNVDCPSLPEMYREHFRDCIISAEPEVGERLAYILMRLQVHHSRMRELSENPHNRALFRTQSTVNAYFYRIAEIQALINKTFDYARNLEEFDNNPLEWENYRNALSISGIHIDDYDDLQGFIERAISRDNQ